MIWKHACMISCLWHEVIHHLVQLATSIWPCMQPCIWLMLRKYYGIGNKNGRNCLASRADVCLGTSRKVILAIYRYTSTPQPRQQLLSKTTCCPPSCVPQLERMQSTLSFSWNFFLKKEKILNILISFFACFLVNSQIYLHIIDLAFNISLIVLIIQLYNN